eukprot:m.172168 g.172168  ORF g.172168 m.172168 type:complete len:309 (+) comp14827_c0_seq10:74-1000(+)
MTPNRLVMASVLALLVNITVSMQIPARLSSNGHVKLHNTLDGPSPPNAAELVLYHVNPSNYSGITNMNTGDAAGDTYFDLLAPSQYYLCYLNKTAKPYPGQCGDPEEFGVDLVVTQVKVQVSPHYGQYRPCNICVNGTTAYGGHCTDGDYFCGCSGSMCPPNVGQLPVAQEVAGYARWAKLETAGPSAYWLVNLGDRVGGLWYSTFGSGDCDSSSKTACTWKLTETVKKVQQVCLEAGMRKRVEALLPSCFGKCPGGSADPNTMCYIHCFYSALLGFDAATTRPATGGLTGPKIVELWTTSFDACPAL